MKYLLLALLLIFGCKSSDKNEKKSGLFSGQLNALKIDESKLAYKNKKWQKYFSSKKYSYTSEKSRFDRSSFREKNFHSQNLSSHFQNQQKKTKSYRSSRDNFSKENSNFYAGRQKYNKDSQYKTKYKKLPSTDSLNNTLKKSQYKIPSYEIPQYHNDGKVIDSDDLITNDAN